MNRRLRQWGRYAPREPETKLVPPPMEPSPDTSWVTFEPISQSFIALHDDPLLMDTTLDPKPRKGRHRRQR
jgi:Uma2 family endonuclease